MTWMLILVVVGLLLIAVGGGISKRRIRSTFGGLDPTAVRMAEGSGVVPGWVSMLVLLGWLGVIVGLIGVVITAVS